MIISLIVAMEENNGIGKGGSMPWHLSTDLKRFKSLTMGHHMVMGRKTYEAVGRPLPGRTTIIVTRDPYYLRDTPAERLFSAPSLASALEMAKASGETEVFVIGGGEMFRQVMALANRIYLTRVHASLKCDTFFPQIEAGEWEVVEQEDFPASSQDQYATTFQVLDRTKV
jgi:dihydrofolate reductase